MRDAAMVHTSTPYRVSLPPVEYLTVPAIREAAELYVRLHREAWDHHQNGVDRAERAVLDAQAKDEQAMADALLDSSKPPKPRTATLKAEAALADAKARQGAYWRALDAAYNRLHRAVLDHADEWRENVRADHADALARYRRAAADLARAHRDLVATGGVLSMLRDDPGGLSVRAYRVAGAQLGQAGSAVSEALGALERDDLADVPADPAEADADAETLDVTV